ncbi:hypothetical protein ACILG0_20590 [Pseudomonadota bacterium AL_CKDN230030165-1A_HGKHYDSX7]
MLEFSLAALLTLLLVVAVAARQAREAEDAVVQASGNWMTQVLAAVQAAAARDRSAWERGEPPRDMAGNLRYADLGSPTLEELERAGSLPRGFPRQAPLGFGVQISMRGAACPGVGCRLDAVVATDRPLASRRGRMLDITSIIPLLERLGGQGAWLEPVTGRVIGRAAGEAALAGVEAGRWPGGTVIAWTGQAGAGANQPPLDPRYVQVGDTRDPQLRGHLSVAGSVAAQGAVTAQNAVRAGAHLSVAAAQTEGTACAAPLGALASDASGRTLACRQGRWQLASEERSVGIYRYAVSDGGAAAFQCLEGYNVVKTLRSGGFRGVFDCACRSGQATVRISDMAYLCIASD